MNLKKLIGVGSYWTINKSLAKEVGLEATLILQHLIDLEENYFKGEFWQKSNSIQESTGLSKFLVKKALTSLSNAELLSIELRLPKGSDGISKCYHFTLLKENIGKVFNLCELKNLTDTSKESLPPKVKEFDRVDKEKEDKEKLNKENILDVTSDEDYYGKIFFKIVDNYPANKIGNRQHGLKKFKLLTKDNAKLAAVNLKRYLATANEPRFIKSLQNYIEEQCFSKAWLEAKEMENNNNKPDTNTFTGKY